MPLDLPTVEKLTADEFVEQYEPREFPDGSFIIDRHATRKFPVSYVWTIVEGDDTDNLYAIPGYRIVNRVGYIVTEKPWRHENLEAVWYVYPEDDELYDGLEGF